jgi:hypothetical protein
MGDRPRRHDEIKGATVLPEGCGGETSSHRLELPSSHS